MAISVGQSVCLSDSLVQSVSAHQTLYVLYLFSLLIPFPHFISFQDTSKSPDGDPFSLSFTLSLMLTFFKSAKF